METVFGTTEIACSAKPFCLPELQACTAYATDGSLPEHSTGAIAESFHTRLREVIQEKALGNLRDSMPAQIKQLAIRIETGRAFETECVDIEDGPHKLAHNKISVDVLKVVAPLVMSRELTIAIDGREVPFFIAACSAELPQAMVSS